MTSVEKSKRDVKRACDFFFAEGKIVFLSAYNSSYVQVSTCPKRCIGIAWFV